MTFTLFHFQSETLSFLKLRFHVRFLHGDCNRARAIDDEAASSPWCAVRGRGGAQGQGQPHPRGAPGLPGDTELREEGGWRGSCSAEVPEKTAP